MENPSNQPSQLPPLPPLPPTPSDAPGVASSEPTPTPQPTSEPQPSSPYASNDEKHVDSVRRYPQLNLSDGEFVVADVKRHPIGLFSIWALDILVVLIVLGLSILLAKQSSTLEASGVTINPDLLLSAMALITIIVLIFGWVGSIIYRDNRFYVTNESVIQKIRTGLFSSREQTIALSGVEDASYTQNGVMQYLFGYGSIRLSTVGDETTYRFTLVDRPQTQAKILTNVVEDFKRRNRE